MTVHAYSIYTASEMLGRDRRTLTRLVRNVEPHSNVAGKAKYLLSTFVDLLEAEAKASGGGKTLSDAKARKELAQAESAERENAIESGKWVLFDHAVAWMIRDIIVTKERLLSLSGEMSGVLDAGQCDLLDDKIREALTELSAPDTFMALYKSYNAEARASEEFKARKERKKAEDDKGDAADA
jgi:hypothetical protein